MRNFINCRNQLAARAPLGERIHTVIDWDSPEKVEHMRDLTVAAT